MAALLAFATPASARECYSSSEAVREHHGVSTWSSWTRHAKGHEGEKCYYASTRREVMRNDEGRRRKRIQQPGNDAVPAPSVARAESPASEMMRIGTELRWRRALSERLNEWWFSIYGETYIYIPTFNDRYAGIIPAQKI